MDLCRLLKDSLEKEGYEVFVCGFGFRQNCTIAWTAPKGQYRASIIFNGIRTNSFKNVSEIFTWNETKAGYSSSSY